MLEGLRVIELASYIAAPAAGGIMADWGADVIKIEPLKGDPIRQFFASIGAEIEGNPVFDLDNRGKRGIAIDTGTEEGAEAVRRLAAGADIFLTNLRPGSLARAGLDYEKLSALNPELVYASVTGYGLSGEEKDRPGFDMAAFWSRAGVARLFAPKGTDPVQIRTAFGDHVTAPATVAGILAAIVERSRTGRGRLVETSLLRSGIYALGTDMAIQLALGRVASTPPRENAISPVNNFFQSSDGNWICLMPRQGGADWADLTKAIGREDLKDDPRFRDSKSRRANGPELVRIFDEAFAAHTLDEWRARLDAFHLIWAPVQHPRQVAEDRQAEAAGAFVNMPGADYRSPASPVRFHGADDGPKGPAPQIGQHTEAVLAELGYDKAAIAAMRKSGVIPA
jgi:crotonobetainyl-CoA:carnitine CoA-transferase CaiB-like acyl-CoA transferase